MVDLTRPPKTDQKETTKLTTRQIAKEGWVGRGVNQYVREKVNTLSQC